MLIQLNFKSGKPVYLQVDEKDFLRLVHERLDVFAERNRANAERQQPGTNP
jgi:hypothetical protein